MPQLPPFPGTTGRRDWPGAIDAIRKLMANADDTTQVFRIMQALNVGQAQVNHARLLATLEGGRLLSDQVELAPIFSDPAFVAGFRPGTVGAAYRAFLEKTGYSASGLVDVSRQTWEADVRHPYVWFGRRIRDVHDIWHVLTGYAADEVLGEAALVAFSYAQLGGAGWGFIAASASVKGWRVTGGTLFARAVLEGYRNGKRAAWLAGEDYVALMDEPLAEARSRLGIATPYLYREAQRRIGPRMAEYAARQRAAVAAAAVTSAAA